MAIGCVGNCIVYLCFTISKDSSVCIFFRTTLPFFHQSFLPFPLWFFAVVLSVAYYLAALRSKSSSLVNINYIHILFLPTPSSPATESHLGVLKAKLAKYRNELIAQATEKGPKGEGFEVVKYGNVRERCGFFFFFCETQGHWWRGCSPPWIPPSASASGLHCTIHCMPAEVRFSNNDAYYDAYKARVAMIGFPSVGKSTLLSKLTAT